MANRFIDWLTGLTQKSTTIDGTEITHIGSSGLSQKALLSDVIRYGGGNSTRVTTIGNANISQKSDGTMWLEVTGQTAGNARGAGAFDWQTIRTDATHVAGTRCFAFGYSLLAGGTDNVFFGRDHNAGGGFSTYLGRGCTGTNAAVLQVASATSPGRAIAMMTPLSALTSNSTPTELLAASNASYHVISTNTAYKVRAEVICVNTSTGASAGWTLDYTVKRVSNTVSIVGTPTIIQTAADSGMSTTDGLAITVTADSVNYTGKITVTGLASTNIRWVASLFISQTNW